MSEWSTHKCVCVCVRWRPAKTTTGSDGMWAAALFSGGWLSRRSMSYSHLNWMHWLWFISCLIYPELMWYFCGDSVPGGALTLPLSEKVCPERKFSATCHWRGDVELKSGLKVTACDESNEVASDFCSLKVTATLDVCYDPGTNWGKSTHNFLMLEVT